MQKLVSKFGLAAHLALLTVAPLVFSTTTVLCLAALGLVWLVMEPPRLGREGLSAARHRVLVAMLKDPVFWFTLALAVYQLIVAVNNGVQMVYSPEQDKWYISGAISLLPASSGDVGMPLFSALTAMIVVLQGCRHALGKSGRQVYLIIAATLSGIAALVEATLAQMFGGELMELTHCALHTPFYVGAAHGVLLIEAISILSTVLEETRFKVLIFLLIALGGNLAGLFIFSPTPVFAVYVAAALIAATYAMIHLYITSGSAMGLVYFIFLVVSITAAAMSAGSVMDASQVMERLNALAEFKLLPDGFTGARHALSSLSFGIWKESPWIGCGQGAFPLKLAFTATESDWALFSSLQTAPFNGGWLMLAERGVVGAFVFACPLCCLVFTYFRRAFGALRLGMPAPVTIAGIVALCAVVFESAFDGSYLLPGLPVALLSLLAVAASSFAKENKKNG